MRIAIVKKFYECVRCGLKVCKRKGTLCTICVLSGCITPPPDEHARVLIEIHRGGIKMPENIATCAEKISDGSVALVEECK